LTLNALNADQLVHCGYATRNECVNGLNSLFGVIYETQIFSNPTLHIEGILFTIVEKIHVHTSMKKQLEKTIKASIFLILKSKKALKLKSTSFESTNF
jgi:hypothetical protein